ncbi:hypothetical protein ACFY2Z_13430 [Streptomyces sp. NPDC001222]|uniref:hypothetical protein n=1 Tax=Streptomyces sp. NPDC001222 TaxID=3364548 RepID=UPI0036AAEB49
MATTKRPTARRKTAAPKPEPVKCPDCDGNGEITQAVRVGARKSRITGDHQTGLCLACWGTGEAPTD